MQYGQTQEQRSKLFVFGRGPNLAAPLSLKQHVLSLSAGQAHLALVLTTGEVLVAGSNKHGQLGLNDRTLKSVSQLRKLQNMCCFRVACGAEHTIFLDVNGVGYACGSNQQGQLGIGEYRSKWQPTMVRTNKLTHVFAGGNHSAFLEQGGQMLVAGDNRNGQFGQQMKKLESPTPLSLGEYVSQVALGSQHCLFLAKGKVYSSGFNARGQLGLGHRLKSTGFNLVEGLSKEGVSKVSCSDHSAAITQSGNLYIWGSGTFGQFLSPVKITKAKYPFAEVGLGERFGLAVDTMGSVYAWGTNSYGELGLNTYTSQSTPVLVAQLEGKAVGAVSCGNGYSAVVEGLNKQSITRSITRKSIVGAKSSIQQPRLGQLKLYQVIQTLNKQKQGRKAAEQKLRQKEEDEVKSASRLQSLKRDYDLLSKKYQILQRFQDDKTLTKSAREIEYAHQNAALKKELARLLAEHQDSAAQMRRTGAQLKDKVEQLKSKQQQYLRELTSKQFDISILRKEVQGLRLGKGIQAQKKGEAKVLFEENKALRQSLQLANQEKMKLQVHFNSKVEELSQLGVKVEKLAKQFNQQSMLSSRELDSLRCQLATREQELARARQQVSRLKSQQQILRRRLGEQKNAAEQLQSMQRLRISQRANNEVQSIMQQLNRAQGEKAQLLNQFRYLQSVVSEMRNNLLASESVFTNTQKQLIRKQQELATVTAELRIYKDQLQATDRKYDQLIADTVKDRQHCDSELRVLEQKMKALIAEHNQLKRENLVLKMDVSRQKSSQTNFSNRCEIGEKEIQSLRKENLEARMQSTRLRNQCQRLSTQLSNSALDLTMQSQKVSQLQGLCQSLRTCAKQQQRKTIETKRKLQEKTDQVTELSNRLFKASQQTSMLSAQRDELQADLTTERKSWATKEARLVHELESSKLTAVESSREEQGMRKEALVLKQQLKRYECQAERKSKQNQSLKGQAEAYRSSSESLGSKVVLLTHQLQKEREAKLQLVVGTAQLKDQLQQTRLQNQQAKTLIAILEKQAAQLKERLQQNIKQSQSTLRANKVYSVQRLKWQQSQKQSQKFKADMHQKLKQFEKTNNELVAKLRRMEGKLTEAKDQKQSLNDRLSEFEQDIEGYLLRIRQLQAKNQQLSKLITQELERQAQTLKHKVFASSAVKISNISRIIKGESSQNAKAQGLMQFQQQQLSLSQAKVTTPRLDDRLVFSHVNNAQSKIDEKTGQHRRLISESANKLLQLLELKEGERDLRNINERMEVVQIKKDELVHKLQSYSQKIERII